jgi:DNA-binding MarR family transcriptional regulator
MRPLCSKLYLNKYEEERTGMKKNARRRAVKSLQRRRMLEVLEQFRVIVKSIRRHYQDVERRAGLSGAQLWALAQIASQPGARVGELARALAIHQSTASNLLRALEARGLVARERRGRDLRAVQLEPTGKGRRLLGAAPRPLIGVLQQALSELSGERLRALHRELAHVIALMRGKQVAAARALPLSEM